MHPICPAADHNHATKMPDAVLRGGGVVLEELRALSTFTPGDDESIYPLIPCRPLHELSDFVVEDMSETYDDVLDGTISPSVLFDTAEQLAWSIDRTVIADLIAHPTSQRARVAALDLAWIECFIRVASPTDEYRARRNVSRIWLMHRALCAAINRLPFLQWSDIAETYPVNDPRTFLSSGHDQLQEIHLYRVQSVIERATRQIVEHWANGGRPDADAQQEILDIWSGIAKSMANLSRKRKPGEFAKLDRFLSPNDEVIGHGTGSFSTWAKLAGYLCTGRTLMLGSICEPSNWPAFTPEVMPWIGKVVANELIPLNPATDALAEQIEKRSTAFQIVHREAVRRHAPSALSCPAPAMRSITNLCSMNRNIVDHD